MSTLKSLLNAAAGAVLLCAALPAAAEPPALPGPTVPYPSDVTVRLTYEGAIFANAKGMTLHWARNDAEPNKSSCTDDTSLKAYHEPTLFHYMLPYPYNGIQRRSCIEKWPIFEPSSDAKPVGKWTIFDRPDGKKQWAYEGKPLYISIVDREPGEVSESVGSREPLVAPIYLPAGIQLMKTVLGVTLADKAGMTLYTSKQDVGGKPACGTACARTWPPVLAAAGSAATGPWSVVRRDDGQLQWAYENRPLYTYIADEGPAHVEGNGVTDRAAVVLLAVPTPPEGIKIVTTPEGPVYVDRNGMSLYWMTCHEENNDRLSCAREGDTGGIWNGLCGGPDRCANSFRLIKVTDETRKEDALWKIRSVDLREPLKNLDDPSKGTKVWEYNRRLVFTYGGDTEPGEIYGYGIRLQVVADVVTIKAYGAPDQ